MAQDNMINETRSSSPCCSTLTSVEVNDSGSGPSQVEEDLQQAPSRYDMSISLSDTTLNATTSDVGVAAVMPPSSEISSTASDNTVAVKQNQHVSVTKMRLLMTVVARLVLPAVLGVYYALVRNQKSVVEGVRRQLMPAVLAFLANSISRSLSSVQGAVLYPSTTIEPILRLIKLRTARKENKALEQQQPQIELASPNSEATSGEVPEKSVSCTVLVEPALGEPIRADVIFIHGLHGSLVNTWRQGAWDSAKKHVDRVEIIRNGCGGYSAVSTPSKTLASPFPGRMKRSISLPANCTACCNANEANKRKRDENVNEVIDDVLEQIDNAVNKENGTRKRSFSKKEVDGIIKDVKGVLDNIESADETKQLVRENYKKRSVRDENVNELIEDVKDVLEKIDDVFDSGDIDVLNISNNNNNDNNKDDSGRQFSDNNNKVFFDSCTNNYTRFDNFSRRFNKNRNICGCAEKRRGQSCGEKAPYSKCWPKDWLPKDCPGVRVIALNYTTDPYLWRPVWIKKRIRSSMAERSREMTDHLLELGVGQNPIIWVGHSKGGLFVKQMLVDAWENDDKMRLNEISLSEEEIQRTKATVSWCEQTKGIMFYSVPHRGSSLADMNLPLLRQSIELTEIQKDCPGVLDLHKRFMDLCSSDKFSPEIFSFIETSLTLMSILYLRIVAIESADPGIGETCGVPLDHRDICKPTGRNCFLYQELADLINRVV